MKLERNASMVEHLPSSNLVCYHDLSPELTTEERYSFPARKLIIPKTSEAYRLFLFSCGPGKLILDGKAIVDIEREWWSIMSFLFMSYDSPEEQLDVTLEAGRSYELVLESPSREPKPHNLTYVGMLEREEEAIELVRTSDVAIVVIGRDQDREMETSDMASMDLPGRSNELIFAVAKTRSRLFFNVWYQGQKQGNSLADVLLGTAPPCGKLPITSPHRIEDIRSFNNHFEETDVVHYGENIYLRYKRYDHCKIDPLFPFGSGCSYTTFEYTNLRLNTNMLEETGRIEFYVSPVSRPRLGRPPKELKGWDKALVHPGETVIARTTLDKVSVSYRDNSVQKWMVAGNA
ncbi:hypothetical protein CORC01_14321 [Colletotrichum orchidophilum]|uniref:beta-glucosidase n=1 Tax=Colletotrichum orchidophilum TaxID=1209926 RepID=A0A1G4AMS7_9PEZI|nr:uncharacterized protein CORC01_14321 [Colletotrichum orchidophilum]OHE90385.1 hypothetical protein CORC01_14321 [Colletotrichum orchidophilum]